MRRALAVSALAALVLGLAAAGPAAGAPRRERAGAGPQAQVDVNGDGFGDLAVGAPGEGIGNVPEAGALNVFFGSATGLQPSGDVLFQGFQPVQGGPVPGVAEPGDNFGAAVAKGLFNDDDFFDVAVGVPSETVGPDVQTGAANLLAGSTTGPSGGRLLLQGNPEDFDNFGGAIAGGFFLHDFDNNGFFDLAVGAPLERVGTHQSAGALSVFYASGGGTLTPGPTFFQGIGGVGGTAESFDFFGAAME